MSSTPYQWPQTHTCTSIWTQYLASKTYQKHRKNDTKWAKCMILQALSPLYFHVCNYVELLGNSDICYFCVEIHQFSVSNEWYWALFVHYVCCGWILYIKLVYFGVNWVLWCVCCEYCCCLLTPVFHSHMHSLWHTCICSFNHSLFLFLIVSWLIQYIFLIARFVEESVIFSCILWTFVYFNIERKSIVFLGVVWDNHSQSLAPVHSDTLSVSQCVCLSLCEWVFSLSCSFSLCELCFSLYLRVIELEVK